VETSGSARPCSFTHVTALEFDPQLRRLMTEAPLTRIRMPYGEGTAWLATRYEDIRVITADRRFSRRAVTGLDFPRMTPEPIVQDESINLMDPPEHSRLRRLVAKGFTGAQVERQRPATERVVDELLDAMAEHGPPADVASQLAAHVPLTTICELLHVPEEDRPALRGHAVALMVTGPGQGETQRQAKAALRAYFTRLTAERRRHPGEDLLSTLAAARDGGELLNDEELAVMGMVLMLTGHDTTTYQISNITYSLLTRPALLAKLRAEPELLPGAIHELLRHIPFRKGVGIPRIATEDVELGGELIRAGDTVHVSYLAANRDPEVYDNPDELDIARERAPHMTFGWGSHHCLGSHLALMELEVVIGRLLRRFPDLRLAVPAEEISWNTSSIWRFPLCLPVAW
jgi:cytochrome P450